MNTEHIFDYHQANFRVFALWGMDSSHKCECGDPTCTVAGKHPRVSNWQNVPHWSDEQMDFMLEHQITTGFGVVIDDQLVIDIDPRNGGMKSYEKLCKDLNIDFVEKSNFVVATGGGGLHIYFSRPSGAFTSHIKEYKGIDFKTSGFVVGAGSEHKSGQTYEVEKGFPTDLTECPKELLELLHKKQHVRALINGSSVDVTREEIKDIIAAIANDDCHYDDFIQVGMGIHHATNGDGFDIWDSWAQQSSKYDPSLMSMKWHSFGKSSNPVTLGTLIYLAEQNGYTRPVTFPLDEAVEYEREVGELPFDASIYDPKRPPGFVGKITDWINNNSYSEPLENLSVISALTAIGNIIGLHSTDDLTSVSTNLLVLCVAESASGKEMVQKSYAKILQAAGMSRAIAGGIKSKQEIARNLIEHQAVFYLIDEMGEVLRTIENAKKRGGAAYLEGVTGEVMSIFTKANSEYQITGDLRRELLEQLRKEKAMAQSIVDSHEDEGGRFLRKVEALEFAIIAVANSGLPRPFLSMIGYSVPASLECIMTEEMAKNGFLSRAILAIEENDNPKPRLDSKGLQELPLSFVTTLKHLSNTGKYDMMDDDRLEFYDTKRAIKTTDSAKQLLNDLRIWEWEYAEHHRETSGFTPLIRRSYELISKISTILAAPEGLRTDEHVKWAAVYVKRDIDRKIRHILNAISNNSKNNKEIQAGIEARIVNLCQRKGGEKESVILNKLQSRKGVTRDDLQALLDDMVKRGFLAVEEKKTAKHKPFKLYESLVN